MRCWKCCRKSWHEHRPNDIDGIADRLLRVCRSCAGSVLQAGCESCRFAQGYDEANDLAGDRFLGHRACGLDAGAGACALKHCVPIDGTYLYHCRAGGGLNIEGTGKHSPRRWSVSHCGWRGMRRSDRTMNKKQTVSRIFSHSRIDIIPVLAAVAHLAFDIYLIVGFATRPIWLSVLLGCVYAVSISWNINSVSHNFIHMPYFKPRWMNYAFSLLESIAIGFSQTYYHWIHMRHHTGNSDRQDEQGDTIDWLSIYRHRKNGKPESVWGYTFLSFFRDNMGDVHKPISKRRRFDAA